MAINSDITTFFYYLFHNKIIVLFREVVFFILQNSEVFKVDYILGSKGKSILNFIK